MNSTVFNNVLLDRSEIGEPVKKNDILYNCALVQMKSRVRTMHGCTHLSRVNVRWVISISISSFWLY